MCSCNILHLHIAVRVGVCPMEGTVDNEEPHVRPGLSNLSSQARQLIPPLLPELRAVLCTGSSEQTVNSGGRFTYHIPDNCVSSTVQQQHWSGDMWIGFCDANILVSVYL